MIIEFALFILSTLLVYIEVFSFFLPASELQANIFMILRGQSSKYQYVVYHQTNFI